MTSDNATNEYIRACKVRDRVDAIFPLIAVSGLGALDNPKFCVIWIGIWLVVYAVLYAYTRRRVNRAVTQLRVRNAWDQWTDEDRNVEKESWKKS